MTISTITALLIAAGSVILVCIVLFIRFWNRYSDE